MQGANGARLNEFIGLNRNVILRAIDQLNEKAKRGESIFTVFRIFWMNVPLLFNSDELGSEIKIDYFLYPGALLPESLRGPFFNHHLPTLSQVFDKHEIEFIRTNQRALDSKNNFLLQRLKKVYNL